MKKILNFFDNIEAHIIVIILPVMTILTCIATFGRYTGLFSIAWAEESTRYMYIWLAFLGVGYAAKSNSHFRVGAPTEMLPKKWQVVAFYIYNAITIIFLIILIKLSYDMLLKQIRMKQLMPMLRIPMWIAYLAIPVGCFFMILRTVQHMVREYSERKRAGDDGEVKPL